MEEIQQLEGKVVTNENESKKQEKMITLITGTLKKLQSNKSKKSNSNSNNNQIEEGT